MSNTSQKLAFLQRTSHQTLQNPNSQYTGSSRAQMCLALAKKSQTNPSNNLIVQSKSAINVRNELRKVNSLNSSQEVTFVDESQLRMTTMNNGTDQVERVNRPQTGLYQSPPSSPISTSRHRKSNAIPISSSLSHSIPIQPTQPSSPESSPLNLPDTFNPRTNSSIQGQPVASFPSQSSPSLHYPLPHNPPLSPPHLHLVRDPAPLTLPSQSPTALTSLPSPLPLTSPTNPVTLPHPPPPSPPSVSPSPFLPLHQPPPIVESILSPLLSPHPSHLPSNLSSSFPPSSHLLSPLTSTFPPASPQPIFHPPPPPLSNPIPSIPPPSPSPSNSLPSVQPLEIISIEGEGEGEGGEEQVRSQVCLPSLCFSLAQGRVSSLACTADGCFVIASFCGSGEIRLFEMARQNSPHPEDRFGHCIGRLPHQATSRLQPSLFLGGGSLRGGGGGEGSGLGLPCEHLFVGAKHSYSSLLVLDLRSLRESLRNRGFISAYGGGVRRFLFSQSGGLGGWLSSLQTLSCLSIPDHPEPVQEGEKESEEDGESEEDDSDQEEEGGGREGMSFSSLPGYVCRYRAVLGKGQSFLVCDIEIRARGRSVLRDSRFLGRRLEYSRSCQVLFKGGNTHPHLLCSGLSFPRPILISGEEGLGLGQGQGSTFIEVLSRPYEKELRSQCLLIPAIQPGSDLSPISFEPSALQQDRPRYLKNTSNIFAVSDDCRFLLGGLHEFQIFRYLPRHPLPSESQSTSSLSTSPSPANMTFSEGNCELWERFPLHSSALHKDEGQGQSQSRQFLLLESGICTSDGSHALLRCSDGSVLLYSQREIFPGRGIPALLPAHRESCEGEPVLTGHLTLLFQVKEPWKVELSISFASSPTSSSERSTSISPSTPDLLVGVGWWDHNLPQKGSSLKAFRLPSQPLSRPLDWEAFPRAICVPGVGLVPPLPSPLSLCCEICGEKEGRRRHWGLRREKERVVEETSTRKRTNRSVPKEIEEEKKRAKPSVPKPPPPPRPSLPPPGPSRTGSLLSAFEEVSDKEEEELDEVWAGEGEGVGLEESSDEEEDTVRTRRQASHKKKSFPSTSSRALNTQSPLPFSQSSLSPSPPSPVDSPSSHSSLLSSLKDAEARLQESRVERDVARRDAHRAVDALNDRINRELLARRAWRQRETALQEEVAGLKRRVVEIELAVSEKCRERDRLEGVVRGVGDLLGRVVGEIQGMGMGRGGGGGSLSETSSLGLSSLLLPSLLPSEPSCTAPFCVVCQDYTADVAVIGCGHVCLCREHANVIQTQFSSRGLACPLCKAPSTGFCPLLGLDKRK